MVSFGFDFACRLSIFCGFVGFVGFWLLPALSFGWFGLSVYLPARWCSVDLWLVGTWVFVCCRYHNEGFVVV